MSEALRIGLVGYGAIGRHHARNLREIEDIDFQGVVETNAETREAARADGYKTFSSEEEIIRNGLDGVVVAVPTDFHEDVVEIFLNRSCPVLVEKPIASRIDAGSRLIALAESKNVPLMIGYVERHNPGLAFAKSFIDEGHLGQLLSIEARRVGTLPARIKDANVLVDIGVHDIDVIAYLTNQRLKLVAAQGGRAILEDRLDYATLALDAGGITATVITNWVTPVKIRDISITGTRGYLHVDYITQDVRFAGGRDFSSTATFDAIVSQYEAGELITLPVRKEEPLNRELRAFAACLRGERSFADPHIALVSLEIAEAATALIEGANLAYSSLGALETPA